MSLSMFQRMALKKFLKNYIKALPFNLASDESMGFSAALITCSMVSHFSRPYQNDYDKYSKIRASAEKYTISMFAELTRAQEAHIKELIDIATDVVHRDNNKDLSDCFFREVNELPHYKDVLVTKEKVSNLFELFKRHK